MRRPPLLRLPATAHLLALESAVRNGSISVAGRELCLTQSAVSKQLSQLEAQLGTQLVERTPTGVIPTPAGKRYLEQIAPLLVSLEDATVSLMTSRGREQELRLCVAPSFATFWLFPRLRDFQQRHPDILVHIATQQGMPDLAAAEIDAAIVNVLPADPRYAHEAFLWVDAYAVYAAQFKEANGKPLYANDVANLPLLHQTTLPHAWVDYFAAAGIDKRDALSGPRYSTLSLGLQAAIAGMGCALLPDYVTEASIKDGALLRVPSPSYRVPTPYSIVYARHDAEHPALIVFKRWLLEQAQGL